MNALARISLPVFAEAYEGFGNVRGMLHFDGRELRLEFQTSDALFGLLRSAPKALSVDMGKVEDARCSLGWFWLAPYIEIALNDFSLQAQVPGMKDGNWRLRTRFRDRHTLKRLTEMLRFARAQALHQVLERSMPERAQSALPASDASPASIAGPPAIPRTRQAED